MEIAVLHYHFRPGGVRRVIERGLPALVQAGRMTRAVLAAGDAPDAAWREEMESALFPCPVEWVAEPALGYWSEQPQADPGGVRAAVREVLGRLTTGGRALWAHNLSVGRNLILAQEVTALAGRTTGAPLWLHHHDWWWDGRWERWPEMRAQGISGPAEAMAVTLPRGPEVRHFCINAGDAERLRIWTEGRIGAQFLPNPATWRAPSAAETAAAGKYLRGITGRERAWLYPARGLRRKNLAEAVLVQRWLAPEAAVVTTGAVSSAAETGYCLALTRAAARHGWPFYGGVAARTDSPAVESLIAAADVLIMTSLREGCGLPFFEAAAAERPLAARLPAGWQTAAGREKVHVPVNWQTLRVTQESFDETAETARVAEGRRKLAHLLPGELHAALEEGEATAGGCTGGAMDFGGLTLAAQLEVLSQPEERLRRMLREQNPEITAALPPRPPEAPSWPPERWARAFLNIAGENRESSAAGSELLLTDAQAAGLLVPAVREWLQFPLLWPADATQAASPPPQP